MAARPHGCTFVQCWPSPHKRASAASTAAQRLCLLQQIAAQIAPQGSGQQSADAALAVAQLWEGSGKCFSGGVVQGLAAKHSKKSSEKYAYTGYLWGSIWLEAYLFSTICVRYVCKHTCFQTRHVYFLQALHPCACKRRREMVGGRGRREAFSSEPGTEL